VIYIGMDDTDNKTSRGTGRLARNIASILSERYMIRGITRHQLLFDPRIPYTANNSSAAIHLSDNGAVELSALADEVQALMLADWQDGSDPGLCVARDVVPPVSEFGRSAKVSVVRQSEALGLAEHAGCILRGLGGTCDGIIGALSAVGLAATGDDGRFILIGTVRDLQGLQTVQNLLASGIAEVRTLGGTRLDEGIIDTSGKLRPAFRENRPVLFVEKQDVDSPHWLPVKLD